jgi:micrococcal nuclease
MCKGKLWGFWLIIGLLLQPVPAWTWSGKVIGIAGGDFISVSKGRGKVPVHLYGIDCPEKGQAFGKEAKQFTREMVFGKVVEIVRVPGDGRAFVAVGKRILNEELVKAGYAWVYLKDCEYPGCKTWKSLQMKARTDKLGLWADPNPIPPWEFRQQRSE